MGQRVTLNRALSKLGYGSRGQATEWIRQGKVFVDGRVACNPLAWVDLACQKIKVDLPIEAKAQTIILLLHKPRGVVCTHADELGRKTIYDLISPEHGHLFSAGRLDADSEGLLLISNDSTLTDHLTSPEHAVEKTYEVTIRPPLPEPALAVLRKGVDLDGQRTRPCAIQILESSPGQMVLAFVMKEGRNRQIRKMVQSQGSKVRRLIRTAIGKITLDSLAVGAIRTPTREEIASLRIPDPAAGGTRRASKPRPTAKAPRKPLPGKRVGSPGAGSRSQGKPVPGQARPSSREGRRRPPR